jgi:hypothetical protein
MSGENNIEPPMTAPQQPLLVAFAFSRLKIFSCAAIDRAQHRDRIDAFGIGINLSP